jgi:hypothetical protein
MSYGLRIWDASGKLKFDPSIRITRWHSQHFVSLSPRSETNIYISGYVPGDKWSYYNTDMAYIRITEFSGRIYIYNESYTDSVSFTLGVLQT